MKVLITLGPTRESIDPIRFISNASSGKMGISLTREGLERGHDMTLVSGPINLDIPESVKVHNVTTAEEMINTTINELKNNYNLLISTAAIADYSPELNPEKIKSGKPNLTIKLKPSPKLTKMVKEKYPSVHVVAFKAEYNLPEKELIDIAYSKLRDENLDLVIANDVGINKFGSDTSDAYIVKRDKEKIYIDTDSKRKISKKIWDAIEESLNDR